jgi:myxalamid-type polyketide synthase MxaE and MxaD
MMHAEALIQWLSIRLSERLSIPRDHISINRPFAELGLDSKSGLEMLGALEQALGRRIDPAIIFDHSSIAALARALNDDGSSDAAPKPSQIGAADEPIAIVGIGCRFPGGVRGPAAFWSFLSEGISAVGPPDASRVRLTPDLEGTPGGWLADVDVFDAEHFGITPREAQTMDPQQRLLLETSWEALEDGGINPRTLRGSSMGVFVGLSTAEYSRHQSEALEPQAITGNAGSIAANRISYVYDVNGPSMSVDTACSSSLTAVDLACRALRSGDADLALAGGANIILSQRVSWGFDRANLMAADGRCKTFDDRADGYVRGEGVAFVVLKRLEQAVTDGDRIYALILATAIVQDGRSNGLMAPSAAAQAKVIGTACQKAGVEPKHIAYLEAHGTGTHLGDVVELSGVARTVGAPGRSEPCRLGSVKTNMGHLEAAAGVAGLIKVALCLSHDTLVPSLNFEVPNSRIDWPAINATVQTVTEPWPGDGAPLPASCESVSLQYPDGVARFAAVSSFGFGGTNVNAVLASPPSTPGRRASAGDQVLGLTARTEAGLRIAAADFARTLQGCDDADLAGLCRASFSARAALDWRVYVRAASRQGATDDLLAFAGGRQSGLVAPRASRPGGGMTYVFSGQGYQWSGMGRRLYETDPSFRTELLRLSKIVQDLAGWSPLEVMFSAGRRDDLKRTMFAQPVLLVLQSALATSLSARGAPPTAMIGHSLGEISALHAAGVLDSETALRIVIARAEAMDRAPELGAMLAVNGQARSDLELILPDLAPKVTVAAENGPTSVVLSGPRDQIDTVRALLKRRRIASTLLPGGYAFHNPWMIRPDAAFLQRTADAQIHLSQMPIYSTVTGRVLAPAEIGPTYWSGNMQHTVEFRRAVDAALADGRERFVEIGPQPVLSTHLKSIARHSRAVAITVAETLDEGGDCATRTRDLMAELWLSGLDITSVETPAAGYGRVSLPPTAFKPARHWLDPSYGKGIHPFRFLGEAVQLADTGHVLLQGTIDPQRHEFLHDHKLGRLAVFPAAGVIEVFLEASRAVGATDVSELQLLKVLPLTKEPLQIQVLAVPKPGGRFEAVLHARTGLGRWAPYAKASLGMSEIAPPIDAVDLARLKSTYLNQFPGPPLYAALRERGHMYGPAFRLLRQVWFDEVEALGEIEAGALLSRTGFEFEPALLDACFHTAITLLGEPDVARSYLPVGVKHIQYLHSPQGRLHALAKIVTRENGRAAADFSIFDAKGCCMILSGFQFQAAAGTRRTTTVDPKDAFLYTQTWKAVQTEAPSRGQTGRWLIFEDEGGVARRLSSGLARAGIRPIFVRRAETFAQIDDGFELGPGGNQPLTRVIAEASREGDLTGILYAWPLDQAPWPRNPTASDDGPAMVMRILQAHAKSGRGTPPDLHLLTRLAQSVNGGVVMNPAQAAIWGFARAIPFEHPNIRCNRIDLGAEEDDLLNAEPLLSLLLGDRPDDQFALRHGTIWTLRLTSAEPASLMPDTRELSSDGVYIVTGGTSALGLRTLSALAQVRKGAIAVISRSAPSAAGQAALDSLASEMPVRHFACDVADEAALTGVIAVIEAEMGQIRGVLHLAGVLDDGAILNLTPARIAAVVDPKVKGAANLCAALEGRSLDLFVMYSSVASILGSPGQSSYMAANAVLDALAHYLRGQGVAATTVNWGPWSGGGMATSSGLSQSPASALMKMFSPDVGQTLVAALLRADVAQAIVLPFDVKPLVQYYPAKTGVLYFEDLMAGDLSAIRSDGGREGVQSRPQLNRTRVAPSNDIERQLCELWGRSLGMVDIGIDDEFFELGGDSVFASQILAEINETFQVNLDPELAFKQLTIANLARLIAVSSADRSAVPEVAHA